MTGKTFIANCKKQFLCFNFFPSIDFIFSGPPDPSMASGPGGGPPGPMGGGPPRGRGAAGGNFRGGRGGNFGRGDSRGGGFRGRGGMDRGRGGPR